MKSPIAAETTTRQIVSSLVWSFVALAAVLATGTIGYRLIGGPQYSWLDCFYMTFITIATIGFNEVVDLSHSPGGRLFTIFVALSGIGVSTYIMSTVVAYLVEGRISDILWRRRMEKSIQKLTQHYVVCGIGRVGRNIANELAATRRSYVVIDENMQCIETHLERHPDTFYVLGDACDDDVLVKAHIDTAIGVFAVTGDDSRNLLITITAKQLNPALRVVARCHEVRNMEKIRKAGADAIVSPDFTGGLRMASAMIRPHVVNFLDEMLKSESNLRVEEIVVPSGFPDTNVSNLKLRGRDCILLAVREKDHWRFNPADDEMVHPGNTLVVMTTPAGRAQLEKTVGWI
jgi:voltage-gated potassium channel